MHGPLRNCAAVTKIACIDRYHPATPLRNCSTLKNEKSKTAVTKIALTGLSEITPFVVQKSRVKLSGYVRGEIKKLQKSKIEIADYGRYENQRTTATTGLRLIIIIIIVNYVVTIVIVPHAHMPLHPPTCLLLHTHMHIYNVTLDAMAGR